MQYTVLKGTVLYKKTGFLTGLLGFGIFLDWIFMDLWGHFWRILGDVLEGFWYSFGGFLGGI